jgi:hypothetical protein
MTKSTSLALDFMYCSKVDSSALSVEGGLELCGGSSMTIDVRENSVQKLQAVF